MNIINAQTGPFIFGGLMGLAILIGVILRKTVPFFRKLMVPASVTGGIVGLIIVTVCINKGIFQPSIQDDFTNIAWHFLSLIYIGIILNGTNLKGKYKKRLTKEEKAKAKADRKENKGKQKKVKKDSANLGGLWLALVFGGIQSILIVFSGVSALLLNKAYPDFNPFYAMLGAHGFANGPTVTLSYGKLWFQQAADVLVDLIPVGMCFATIGYIAAIFVGVPLGKYFIRKKMNDIPLVGTTKEMEEGLFSRESNLNIGRQTTHRSNLDTLSFHVGLIFAIYFITYLWVGKLFGLSSGMFNMIFVCCILTAIVVKALLRKTKFDYLVDDGLITSWTNFSEDMVIVSCIMGIQMNVVMKYIIPIIIVSVVMTLVSLAYCWWLARQAGKKHSVERFMFSYGNATGTTQTGLLLLRLVDPESKSHTAREMTYYSIYFMFTPAIILGMLVSAYAWGAPKWILINVVATIIFTVLCLLVGKDLRKRSEGTEEAAEDAAAEAEMHTAE